MTPLIRKLLGMNWVLVAAMLSLAVFGVFAVYSATFFRPVDYWQRQVVWVGIGLAIFIGLMIVMARTAWRLIRRSEGTEFYPLALFIGLPLIWEPVNFLFIFGGYDSALPDALFGVGMLKMLTHSLDAYAAQTSAEPVEEAPESRSVPVWQRPAPVGAHLLNR